MRGEQLTRNLKDGALMEKLLGEYGHAKRWEEELAEGVADFAEEPEHSADHLAHAVAELAGHYVAQLHPRLQALRDQNLALRQLLFKARTMLIVEGLTAQQSAGRDDLIKAIAFELEKEQPA